MIKIPDTLILIFELEFLFKNPFSNFNSVGNGISIKQSCAKLPKEQDWNFKVGITTGVL